MQRVVSGARYACDCAVRALAIFALANILLGLFSRNWNANDIWIQAGVLPGWLVQALVLAFALGVLLIRRLHPAAALAVRGVALLLALACLSDAYGYYRLLADGRIASALPVPLSLGLGLLLLAWAASYRRRHFTSESRTRRALWNRVLEHSAPLVLLAVGALAHITTFGATDYARPADAAVVFGAAVRENGAPSQALADRTHAAIDLYRRGLVQTLVLSGGRDPRAPLSEPQCMARLAREHGVPAAALILDEGGRDTSASVRAVARLSRTHGWNRILMVSHDYHLARIKLTCRRLGVPALTVPAHESRRMLKKPWFVAREVMAFAYYYANPVALRGAP